MNSKMSVEVDNDYIQLMVRLVSDTLIPNAVHTINENARRTYMDAIHTILLERPKDTDFLSHFIHAYDRRDIFIRIVSSDSMHYVYSPIYSTLAKRTDHKINNVDLAIMEIPYYTADHHCNNTDVRFLDRISGNFSCGICRDNHNHNALMSWIKNCWNRVYKSLFKYEDKLVINFTLQRNSDGYYEYYDFDEILPPYSCKRDNSMNTIAHCEIRSFNKEYED
jgi:hypothetical protein